MRNCPWLIALLSFTSVNIFCQLFCLFLLDVEVEIELREEEAPFLAGQTKMSINMSPVKIVKNPDGSLQRAAQTQSALAKERREVRQAQREAEMDSIPKDVGKLYIDPMPEGGCGQTNFKFKADYSHILAFLFSCTLSSCNALLTDHVLSRIHNYSLCSSGRYCYFLCVSAFSFICRWCCKNG